MLSKMQFACHCLLWEMVRISLDLPAATPGHRKAVCNHLRLQAALFSYGKGEVTLVMCSGKAQCG